MRGAGSEEPDLKIAGLQVWVHGREFPDAADYWDGNWLRVTARCKYAGAQVEIEGPLVHLAELGRFVSGCERLYQALEGSAGLDCIEPNLRVQLSASDKAGHISIVISITPDHMCQEHVFRDEVDQTFLPSIVESARGILNRYPVRGRP